MKKKTFLILIIIFAMLIPSFTARAQAYSLTPKSTAYYTIENRADTLKWRYKHIGNKLYKRLYNETKKVWVGQWVPI